MDAIALATVTAGATALASECGKGLAGEAGKDLWARVKSVLKLSDEPAPERLAPAIAERLLANEQAAREVLALLKESGAGSGGAGMIVGNVDAERLIVIHTQHIAGDFTLNM
ncbi:MAG TPA: hypothetical protein VFE05_16735 [Longimicrobiaceae bacterium]|jgi:hypothetical protein|nr:hypothetical protein [Longimicrobiaceae bacterium]